MQTTQALIITSIASPDNKALKMFALNCHKKNIHFIVIGDSKSPANFKLEHCNYFSIEEQKKLTFSSAGIIPEKKYSRKNIGYLVAMEKGYDVISETDDDNFPMSGFWKKSSMQPQCYFIENKGWINVYNYYTKTKIWPRGYPLEFVNNKVPFLNEFSVKEITAPIQQGLADDNPDVDAVFRLVKDLPIKFKRGPSIALGKNTWCPFNSQNTRWFKPAFPLLYLPTYCSFRMTDIWRSFVAQRILWTNNWSLIFHKPTVYQERNEHNILLDFKDEISGYLNNNQIVKTLEALHLKNGETNIYDNLYKCYEALIKLELIEEKEMGLLEAWCADLKLILTK